MKFIRFLFAILCVVTGGVILGAIASELTGYPDILGIMGWDTLFVAVSGATAYSAVRK
jgi:hypothetical protein